MGLLVIAGRELWVDLTAEAGSRPSRQAAAPRRRPRVLAAPADRCGQGHVVVSRLAEGCCKGRGNRDRHDTTPDVSKFHGAVTSTPAIPKIKDEEESEALDALRKCRQIDRHFITMAHPWKANVKVEVVASGV